MARTNIAAQTMAGAYPSLPVTANAADLTLVGGDVGNGNETPLVDNKTMLVFQNTNVGAKTVTILSVADTLNRTGDITAYSIGAGEVARFGPFKTVGWASSGKLRFAVEHADVLVAVITLP